MINEPYRHYANIKTTIKYVEKCGKYPESQKQDVIKILETEIKKTHDCIKMLDRNFDIKKFEEIVSIEDEVRETFTEAYWDKLIS
jgi:SPX domain protein involved in polyphosphate accumulation